MKTRLKTNKGITLIALVITIIVLLILAGVSIAMLTGENGILTQAQKAGEQTDIGKEKEAIALAYNGAVTEKQDTNVTAKDLNDQFKANGTSATADGESPITVTFESGRQYTIDENGAISEPTEANIVASLKIEGEKVTEPPIPNTGDPSNVFTHVDGTVENGYVIQDTNGSQFVWVPVDKNQKIKINVTSKEDIESITLTDPYGDNILTVENANVETTYSNQEVTPTINGPYVLKVTTASEEKNFALKVHSLYAFDTMTDWMLTDEYCEKFGMTLESMLSQYGCETVEEAYPIVGAKMKGQYEDKEDYTLFVNNNGGFYIGRYEASGTTGNVAVKKDAMPLVRISQTDALSNAKSMYTSSEFTSSLLTGAAWDRTLGWLEETGAVTSYEIVVDSKTWGNYSDDKFSNTTGIANTGAFPETQKNHIYDLAGNVEEWTTEAHSTCRVIRGGVFNYSGSYYPSSNRSYYSPDNSGSYIGYRPALYL